MKVKELITALQAMDPESEVYIARGTPDGVFNEGYQLPTAIVSLEALAAGLTAAGGTEAYHPNTQTYLSILDSLPAELRGETDCTMLLYWVPRGMPDLDDLLAP